LDPHETTVRNTDIWSRYFEQQWSRWLAPLGRSAPVAEVTAGSAARVAGMLTLVAAGPIAWLYASNTNDAQKEDVEDVPEPRHVHVERPSRRQRAAAA
jgi:hypothetical protein